MPSPSPKEQLFLLRQRKPPRLSLLLSPFLPLSIRLSNQYTLFTQEKFIGNLYSPIDPPSPLDLRSTTGYFLDVHPISFQSPSSSLYRYQKVCNCPVCASRSQFSPRTMNALNMILKLSHPSGKTLTAIEANRGQYGGRTHDIRISSTRILVRRSNQLS
ncbi:hypothetical protein PCASD_22207 [Puccinia coronata f. sp. avenae]|uniref:Uncharacterized protein n=1 Tax=Puccinia coronata f. sp. avenae TaxID=200324 RepID=A0A2N5SKL5_9BASI|nr:hypothetical protein PCASD_22207 [Puccinia coronata f. sp. avenae]